MTGRGLGEIVGGTGIYWERFRGAEGDWDGTGEHWDQTGMGLWVTRSN